MQLNPYLTFNGNCEAAFKFYAKVLGGKIEAMMPFKGTPAEKHMPAGWGKKILHASLVVDDGNVLMGSDAGGGPIRGHEGHLRGAGRSRTRRKARASSRRCRLKGRCEMPFQETFWSSGFGMLVDQFGTPWMINCDKAG